jgi:opacity protein-like surface antigen
VAVATKSQNKTGFVKKFLSNTPQGNVKAVNEAWTAARMKGTIGATLINKIRSAMGLSGNLRAKSKSSTAARAKSGTKLSKKTTSPGKAMFVKEFLNDHPQGNVRSVNEAWTAAGFNGTISKTIVYKVKSSLGLTGNLQANTKKSKSSAAAKKLVSPRKKTAATVNLQPRMSNSARTVELNEMEADIDRLIFKAMGIGDLAEIEDTLRRARRLLYSVLTRG